MNMYNDFNIQHEGSAALPVTGSTDTYIKTGLERTSERSYFTVAFFSDATMTTRVTPTAGTVAIAGATNDQMIWKTIAGGSFPAANTYNEDLVIPASSGPMANVRVVFTGVTGATHASVYVSKY